jgi:hypothetical protein
MESKRLVLLLAGLVVASSALPALQYYDEQRKQRALAPFLAREAEIERFKRESQARLEADAKALAAESDKILRDSIHCLAPYAVYQETARVGESFDDWKIRASQTPVLQWATKGKIVELESQMEHRRRYSNTRSTD